MAALKAPSEAVRQIAQALNLPDTTTGFTLRVRAGKVATVHVQTLVSDDGGRGLATVLKGYSLVELGKPLAGDQQLRQAAELARVALSDLLMSGDPVVYRRALKALDEALANV